MLKDIDYDLGHRMQPRTRAEPFSATWLIFPLTNCCFNKAESPRGVPLGASVSSFATGNASSSSGLHYFYSRYFMVLTEDSAE